MQQDPKRRAGNAVAGAALLLLVLCVALGGNYVRNYQIDQAQEKQNRPYGRYGVADLHVLAEGYRMEVAAAEQRQGGQRATARDRYHLSAQIKEFERVQKAAQKNRDRALEIAEMRRELTAIEAELQRRASAADGITLHLTRMFRI
jgi:hypothetical protein